MLRRFGLGLTDMSVRPRFQISSSRLLDRGELSPSTTRGSVGAEWGVEDSVERERFRRFIHYVSLDRPCDSDRTGIHPRANRRIDRVRAGQLKRMWAMHSANYRHAKDA